MIEIRKERPEDAAAIRALNVRAFGQSCEADIVDRLRRSGCELVSLVAVKENTVVGHVLFSPAAIEGPQGSLRGMALAPMAVLPEHRRQGIGSRLVRSGIEELERRGCPFVIVLGHPEYYPRFGFEPASRCAVRCEWEAPDEAFMILVPGEAKARIVPGTARYRPEFSEEA